MELNSLTRKLLGGYERVGKERESDKSPRLKVSQTVSFMGSLYEKMRNAVEYREVHLLRKAAIERILRRRILLNQHGADFAESLVKELLWGKYLISGTVSSRTVKEISDITERYLKLRRVVLSRLDNSEQISETSDWIVGILACRIEYKLAPNERNELFTNYIYQWLKPSVELTDIGDNSESALVYLSTQEAFNKADLPLLRYHFVSLYGEEALFNNFWHVYTQTNTHVGHPIRSRLTNYMRKRIPPFLILKSTMNDLPPQELEQLLTDYNRLDEEVIKIANESYKTVNRRLRRAAFRSVIYLFLTKMLFALILEVPADRYLAGGVEVVPLAINTAFPPLLMLFIALFINPPGKDNTDRILDRIKELLAGNPANSETHSLSAKSRVGKPLLTFIFTLIYGLTFFLIFGFIIWTLTLLGFNIVSQLIFLFFLTVVSFFAYRIKQIPREYRYREKEGILAPIIDFLLLPILEVGKRLSEEIGRINIITFVFDFILEAPFKAVFEVVEEWTGFLRSKREEIA